MYEYRTYIYIYIYTILISTLYIYIYIYIYVEDYIHITLTVLRSLSFGMRLKRCQLISKEFYCAVKIITTSYPLHDTPILVRIAITRPGYIPRPKLHLDFLEYPVSCNSLQMGTKTLTQEIDSKEKEKDTENESETEKSQGICIFCICIANLY